MENRKEHYSKKGLYNAYDKKHKERDQLDYYATPTQEVKNILQTLNINLQDCSILEPCIGGGHLMEGIIQYLSENNQTAALIGTDIKDRGYKNNIVNSLQYNLDFFNDDYETILPMDIDYIIMNPPYSTIEPFVMKALSIANKGVIMLGRLQFLEGEKRFKNIFKENPPSDVYVYVDRIVCYKNGDVKQKMASAQAYAWFYWDKKRNSKDTFVYFLRRANKK